jgi:DNA-binding CsgD family transcriptional regulator
MRDRPPREAKDLTARAGAPDCLASFVVDQRCFQLVLCDHKHKPQPDEVARFSLGKQTLAVIEYRDEENSAAEPDDIVAKLTGRELQIAAMVAQGYATKNIAYKLRISEWTVGTYMQRIFAKLHVRNRAAMVYRCASLMDNVSASARGDFGASVPRVQRAER